MSGNRRPRHQEHTDGSGDWTPARAASREQSATQTSSIMIPLDGSVVSDSALRAGFALAERSQLPVTIVHALDGTGKADAERHLERVVERFSDVAPCDTRVVPGRAADVILDHAQQLRALVCIASRGRSGLARLALGSVAEEVLRRSTAGIVVVGPRGASFALARERASTLFCTDGSEHAAAAAPHAAYLAKRMGLGTTLVQHVEPDEDVAPDGGPPPRPLLDTARANCEALQRYFQSQNITADSRVLFGETTRSIIEAAAATSATLISLASRGRHGLDRFTLGSTAAGLIRNAPCPVFAVGPAAAASTRRIGSGGSGR